ncbi:MAG: type II toxin-antitoxin system HicB family antitoxin [Anaerolineae bacterium]|nr:type II toxin-antitoxin system HicB family antitoxin [Anaerolineae bacterium]
MSNAQEFVEGRRISLYKDENGYWIAEVPSLSGCATDGKTREETLERVKEAIELWIEAAHDHNEPIPKTF